jgi:hypothetical protein
MPGWLMWTLIGLGAWLAASVPFAFMAGYLLSRRPAPRRRVVVLAGPASIRLRTRAYSRTLTRSGYRTSLPLGRITSQTPPNSVTFWQRI